MSERWKGDAGPVSKKMWENVGFACGGFSVALFLLWAGVIGSAGDGTAGVLVAAVGLAALCMLAFVRGARARDGG